MDPEKSDLGPYCLPVCKNRFEKSARIFNRRHKQTTFSDAVFLGTLRVKIVYIFTMVSGRTRNKINGQILLVSFYFH